MKIISWNVNGIRAVEKKGALEWLFKSGKDSPDIFCFQETKAEKEQLSPALQAPVGYHAYFSSSKGRKGYSGVAVYSKIKPDEVKSHFPFEKGEGRVLELHFGKLVFLNVYFPNGGGEPERLEYKLAFYDAFLEHIEKHRKKGKNIIFCGDVNVAHEEIDIARPKENSDHVGFLPEERAWVDELIYCGYVDVYRYFNPKKVEYSWWDMKSAARERNIGWRIDYFFVGNNLLNKVEEIKIMGNVFGSDHCPIALDIDIKL